MNQFNVSLWGDEAFAAVLASHESLREIVKIVAHDTSPPLYYFLLHFWLKLFGASEVAIRFLSFSFHLGTVVTLFLLGRYLWGKRTGFLVAVLTFLNPFLFSYAFEGRMYALLAFTTSLSFYFFLKKQWPAYIFTATTALYTHHFSLFALILQFTWNFFQFIQRPKKNFFLILPFLFIFLFYLPWLFPLYYQTMLVKSGFWLAKPNLSSLFNLGKSFLTQNLTENFKTLVLLLTSLLLFLRRWQKAKRKIDYFLLLWFFLPIFFTFIISQLMSSIFFDRYLLYTLPALLLLLASERRKISLVLISALILIWLWFDLQYFFYPTRRPFSQLAQYIKTQIQANDVLINYPGKAHHLWEAKYYGLRAPLYVPSGDLPFFVGTAQMKPEDIIKSLGEIKKIGVISSEEPQDVKIENFVVSFSQKFDGLVFLWMVRKD